MNPTPPESPRGVWRLLGVFALFVGLTVVSSLMARSCTHRPTPPRIAPSAVAP